MTSRLQLFERALEACNRLRAQFPESQSLTSIQRQLEYLLALEKGEQDRSRLKDIVIAPMVAREVEPLNMEVAELLYQVAAEVRTMQAE